MSWASFVIATSWSVLPIQYCFKFGSFQISVRKRCDPLYPSHDTCPDIVAPPIVHIRWFGGESKAFAILISHPDVPKPTAELQPAATKSPYCAAVPWPHIYQVQKTAIVPCWAPDPAISPANPTVSRWAPAISGQGVLSIRLMNMHAKKRPSGWQAFRRYDIWQTRSRPINITPSRTNAKQNLRVHIIVDVKMRTASPILRGIS